MEAFATPADVLATYRVMDASECERAQSLCEYASAQIQTFLNQHGIAVVADDETQAAILKGVCCASVRRAMERAENQNDVSAWGGNTIYSSTGDVYLLGSEKRMLLGSRPQQKIGIFNPKIGADDD